MPDNPSREELEALLVQARERTLDIVQDLDDDQMLGPRLAIVNPLIWEIGHQAWFQERWTQRHLRGLPPLREDGDRLYDSARVAHDTRWDLPLPSRSETLEYMNAVLERAVQVLRAQEVNSDVAYFFRLAAFHEDMHGEAFLYTRQTLSYPPPRLRPAPGWENTPSHPIPSNSSVTGAFVEVPGGSLALGSARDEPFVFDNEKWQHPVRLEPFAISRHAVTNGEFKAFVEDDGYTRRDLWTPEAWSWREGVDAQHPVYWRKTREGTWEHRVFDRWEAVPDANAIIHVNWYEATAFCRWAGRRLPTEAEWEAAAATAPGYAGKRRFPWGEQAPTPDRANLDGAHLGVLPATALDTSECAWGCRQLLGNVWEWTSTPFGPYPGFSADPYKEYSEPWFDGNHMVLRGGCWATRARLVRNAFRNFYTRDRRDVFAGFRTCAA